MTFTPMGLPPRWDGADVEWRAWDRTDDVFVCYRSRKPRPERCERCRSTAAPLSNAGKASSGPDWRGTPTYRLFAFRCPDCHLDTVWDMRADEWWTLGPEDYGDAGSHDPRLPVPQLDCRTLWWREAQPCMCSQDPGVTVDDEDCDHDPAPAGWRPVWRGSLRPDGRFLVTDSRLAMYVDQLQVCDDMPVPELLPRDKLVRLAMLLTLCPVDRRSDHVFRPGYLDPLEQAGYVVRPLFGATYAHGVLADDGRAAGLLMPIHPSDDPAARPVAV